MGATLRKCLAQLALCLLLSTGAWAADFQFGFSRQDITPDVPLRLSGYGNRETVSEGVDTPLHARAMAMKADGGPLHVLLTVDTIGFPAAITKEIFEGVSRKHQLSRSRFVLCCTHSHTTPHIARGLNNLFAVPLTEEQQAATTAYTNRVVSLCIDAVDAAVADLRPGRLTTATGTVTFARNRRVIDNGVWKGFGVTEGGRVDHSLPLLVVTDPASGKPRGLVFNYACHCTTFGGMDNRVNADWAGYATTALEAKYDGAVALCTIGCGADQNPGRHEDRHLEFSQAEGAEIAEEVQHLLAGPQRAITTPPAASFGFAGLPIDRPTVDDLKAKLNDPKPQVRRHAEEMLAIYERMKRLPETYPMPIQVWRFGNEFAMVFLGGEVCVDYSWRIKRELGAELSGDVANGAGSVPPAAGESGRPEGDVPPHSDNVWVSAYSNDVFAYVASERLRPEGGYEVDFSMIYYLQPGRWSTGTEDVILRRVHELFKQRSGDEPLSVNDALKTFTLPEGFAIEVVACEPLIEDPINFAVDARGRLWVVEMGDYPRGGDPTPSTPPSKAWNSGGRPWDGPPGGKIKVLTDDDGDGRYDRAEVFLDGLTFPTGVFPWRDGTLVSAAPDIFFAKDSDGDGKADVREVLYTGFVESNPQHRVNGFEYGLDGWLYLAAGDSSGEITCLKTGEKVDVSGRDLRIHPETGRLEAVSGRSQYGRCRDDFGNWFGNTNSEPLFTFPIEDRDLRRNPFVPSPSPRLFLTQPDRAPPVYPTSRTVDRFNDLFAANRFTSACSPCIFRDSSLGPDLDGAALVCEPVHNLVSRVMLEPDGVTFRGRRHPSEQQSEFLSSTDMWFRPVRLMTAPDRSLWVCDMYRHVIEHPQWIPEAWQTRLDLYAGKDMGRIYRVYRKETPPEKTPRLDRLPPDELVDVIASEDNGWRRDTAQEFLAAGVPPEAASSAAQRLQKAVASANQPRNRLQALWTLVAAFPQHPSLQQAVATAFHDADPRVAAQAIRAVGLGTNPSPQVVEELLTKTDARAQFELVLAAATAPPELRRHILLEAARTSSADVWMRAALLSSAVEVAGDLLPDVIRQPTSSPGRSELLSGLIATAIGQEAGGGLLHILKSIAPVSGQAVEPWRLEILAACLDAQGPRGNAFAKLTGNGAESGKVHELTASLFAAARDLARDDNSPLDSRLAAIRVLGRGPDQQDADRDSLHALVVPQAPPELQSAALQALARLGDVDFLLERFPTLAPARQATVQTLLLSKEDWSGRLIAAVESGAIPMSLIDASTRAGLRSTRKREVRDAAARLFGDAGGERAAIVEQFHESLTATGDSARGRTLFEKKCAACHRHQGLGNEVGPQLSALTNKSADFLLTAILDPNRSVEAKYRGATLVTTDGLVHSGMISEETATSVTLARPDGKKDILLRREIEGMTVSPLSFMPEGLEKDVTPQDLADVMAFVQLPDAK